MSAGGGKSESSGSNASVSMIDKTQMKYLEQLWQSATGGILNNGVGAADTQAQGNFMNNIANNPFMQRIQSFADPNNAMAQNNINMLGQNLNQNLQRNLMPQIQSNAIQGGGLGGGRQGIAQGLAVQGTQQAFGQGASQIMNSVYDQARQTAQYGGDLALRIGMGGMQALGMGQQQQLAPLMALAQILGDPTVVGSSYGKNSSESQNYNIGLW